MSNKRNYKGNNTRRSSSRVQVSEQKGTFTANMSSKLCTDFGNLNYSYLPGSTIYKDWLGSQKNVADAVPGMMVFPTIPIVGDTGKSTSPINLAANKIYAKVRSVNSGAKNYDPNNLMIYIMSMDSIYSFHAWMLRVYGVAHMYTSHNYYYPDMLLQAMGVDPANIRYDLKKLEGYIDLFVARANTVCVPDVLPLIKDHARMFNVIYTDERSVLAQNYMFNPAGFYHYVENENAGALFGTLQWSWMFKKLDSYTVDDIIELGNSLLEDILMSEDMALMSGDLQKAYGESALLTLPQVSSDYTTQIVYDETALLAIRNANTVPYVDGYTNITVGAITGNATNSNLSQYIQLKPATTLSNEGANMVYDLKTHLIDQHKDSPTIEDNFMAIRFKYTVDTLVSNAGYILGSAGTELLLDPTVLFYDSYDSGELALFEHTIRMNRAMAEDGSIPNGWALINELNLWNTFEMAPTLYLNTGVVKDGFVVSKNVNPIGELYNPTLVGYETFKNMLIAYFMSEFGIE